MGQHNQACVFDVRLYRTLHSASSSQPACFRRCAALCVRLLSALLAALFEPNAVLQELCAYTSPFELSAGVMEFKTVLVRCVACTRLLAHLALLLRKRSSCAQDIIQKPRSALQADKLSRVASRLPRRVEEPERLYDREAVLGRDATSVRHCVCACNQTHIRRFKQPLAFAADASPAPGTPGFPNTRRQNQQRSLGCSRRA